MQSIILPNSTEVRPESLITAQRGTLEKFTILTRQKSKLFHQIITDVLCTDGRCGFWKKAKAEVKKEAKAQSKYVYQCVNPKVGLQPNPAALNYV